ncbi:histidinol-phosphate aminotransferase [Cylindrobasidium torrendii FP15055 ss-10]|uniref:histidinol-phosphate transaminase n=1 Tax=Cylindrobasidium torrendii FP15055 ss-10 TaxID=1314674 RepID=A0A0D7BH59_9AGAR|nr:histidinol-phosphate aminotransferase [Cylindrobasidium torrendii FP15055 ss-10]
MTILGLTPSSLPVQPAHFDIEKVIRPNILALHPYRCARDDYNDGILLDANENSLGASIPSDNGYHRYPDPSLPAVKERIAALRGLPGIDHIALGVGSDEITDLLMRVCVVPSKEKILVTPPTYGMYSVCAAVNDVGVVKVPLELSGANGESGVNGRFSLRVDAVKQAIDADPSIKLIFLCSPGNPTGTLIPLESIKAILDYPAFKGIVVVDEAYIDFSPEGSSAVELIKDYANVCVMQTLSKGFGLAGIRLGMALAQPPLIQILFNTKAPYNIASPTAALAYEAYSPESLATMRSKTDTLNASRTKLLQTLSTLPDLGPAIGGNCANFIMVPVLAKDGSGKPDSVRAQKVYKALAEENGVVVRFRGSEPGCEGCLRITIGSEEELETVVQKFRDVLKVL